MLTRTTTALLTTLLLCCVSGTATAEEKPTTPEAEVKATLAEAKAFLDKKDGAGFMNRMLPPEALAEIKMAGIFDAMTARLSKDEQRLSRASEMMADFMKQAPKFNADKTEATFIVKNRKATEPADVTLKKIGEKWYIAPKEMEEKPERKAE